MLLAAVTAFITLSSTASALKYNETLDPYNVNKNRGQLTFSLVYFAYLRRVPLTFSQTRRMSLTTRRTGKTRTLPRLTTGE